MEEKNKKYPEGHFIGMWMAIGCAMFTGFGIPLGIALGNLGLIWIGPALGAAFGIAIGSSIESKYKKEGKIRPLTKDEKNKRKIAVMVGIAVLIAFFILGLAIFLLQFFL